MDDRMSLPMASARRQPSFKKRLENLFGTDWKVGYLFVLPMVLIMALLIFWPFVSAIFISTTSLNYLTGETVNVGMRNYGCGPVAIFCRPCRTPSNSRSGR